MRYHAHFISTLLLHIAALHVANTHSLRKQVGLVFAHKLLVRILLLASGLLLTILLLGVTGILGSLGLDSLGTVVLRHGLQDSLLLLGLNDGDGIGQCLLRTSLAFRVGATHDLDLDTEHTLTEENVTGGVINEVLRGLTRVNHEAISELHRLGTGGTEFAGDDDLATLGTRLHNEAENTVTGTTNGETVKKLVAERLALRNGRETTVLDLSGVEGDGVLGELEALLNEGSELADAATLLAENLLGVGGADDDVGNGRGDANLDARVSLLSELALEELVELGIEDTIGDELSPLGAVSRTCQHYFLKIIAFSLFAHCQLS